MRAGTKRSLVAAVAATAFMATGSLAHAAMPITGLTAALAVAGAGLVVE